MYLFVSLINIVFCYKYVIIFLSCLSFFNTYDILHDERSRS